MSSSIELVALTPDELAEVLSSGGRTRLRAHAGVAEDLLPEIVARDSLARHRQGEEWFWCAPRVFYSSSLGMPVGSGCFKGAPRSGEVEIGYGVISAYEGRGYGTAGVAQLVDEAFERAEVVTMTAQTSPSNRGSERVLEKNGFFRVGIRKSADEGPLTLWRRERDADCRGSDG
jgi:RimJ/RimL family protein N-acetyltransferase